MTASLSNGLLCFATPNRLSTQKAGAESHLLAVGELPGGEEVSDGKKEGKAPDLDGALQGGDLKQPTPPVGGDFLVPQQHDKGIRVTN